MQGGVAMILAMDDARLLARAAQRLIRNGMEARRLRSLLLIALIDAAQLAGDKREAAQLRLKLDLVARAAPTSRGC